MKTMQACLKYSGIILHGNFCSVVMPGCRITLCQAADENAKHGRFPRMLRCNAKPRTGGCNSGQASGEVTSQGRPHSWSIPRGFRRQTGAAILILSCAAILTWRPASRVAHRQPVSQGATPETVALESLGSMETRLRTLVRNNLRLLTRSKPRSGTIL